MATTILLVILGVIMIIGGICLLATPLFNFMSLGYMVIIMFCLSGIFGIIRGIRTKQYGKDFVLAIIGLILGIIGLAIPDAAAMTNNFILLYLAAGWFILHGILSIVDAIALKKLSGTGLMVLGIILGVLEIIMGIYSAAHPAVLALSLGMLVGFYFIESGINLIVIGCAVERD